MLRYCCRLTVFFAMPAAVALSQCMGVDGCRWPSSSSVTLIIFASFTFKNIAPNSASTADAATKLRIVQSVRIGPFRQMGCLSSGCQPRKKWPTARLLGFLLKDKIHRSVRLSSCRMGRILLLRLYSSLNNPTCGSCLLLFSVSRVPVRLRVYSVRWGGCCWPSAHNIRCYLLLFGRV